MKVTATIIGYLIWGGVSVPVGIKELFEGGRLNELEGDGLWCTEGTATDPVPVAIVTFAVGVFVDAFDAANVGDALREEADKLPDAVAAATVVVFDVVSGAVEKSVILGDADKLPDGAGTVAGDEDELFDVTAVFNALLSAVEFDVPASTREDHNETIS